MPWRPSAASGKSTKERGCKHPGYYGGDVLLVVMKRSEKITLESHMNSIFPKNELVVRRDRTQIQI